MLKDTLKRRVRPLPAGVMVDGGTITFQAQEGDGILTAVIDHLRQHQHPIHNIHSEPPSLEDVFMHAMGDE